MEIRIENVLSDENLGLAKESLQGKRDSCGVDGIKISMFDDYWEANEEKIKQEMSRFWEPLFSEYAYAYRKCKGRTLLKNTLYITMKKELKKN